ncbi:B3 domain-containing protein Os07g0679700 [Camellia lanceoleosa]|uniref:B3 domain-containing protein Os07g0679700 n=1 Tax=Camellia lanceoleosa TaxID=1840588 RepID=A0ACC0F5V8_9ERIC|nr:B3 domain-containing protein Os07g0679700 [Camellia lanceoleosa]
MYKSLAQPSTSLIFSNPLETPYSVLPSLGGAVEGREQNKVPPVKQGKKTHLILPKPPKTGLIVGSDANRGMVSQTRVLRLPDEGRGYNQLLPRYWPRVTDEELQQISGEYP